MEYKQMFKNPVLESKALQTGNCIPLENAVSKFTLDTVSITLVFMSH